MGYDLFPLSGQNVQHMDRLEELSASRLVVDECIYYPGLRCLAIISTSSALNDTPTTSPVANNNTVRPANFDTAPPDPESKASIHGYLKTPSLRQKSTRAALLIAVLTLSST
jgi:hypothetical protein